MDEDQGLADQGTAKISPRRQYVTVDDPRGAAARPGRTAMNDPYRPPESALDREHRRNFSPSLVTPLSVAMVVLIYAGYAYYFFSGEQDGVLASVTGISFEVFLASQAGIILIGLFTRKQLNAYLRRHPVICDRLALEHLKPVARANMHNALVNLFLLGLTSLTAIMSILNYGGMISIAVVVVSLASGRVCKWCARSEEKIKQIECSDAALERELTAILHCWQHKALPNF
jgi:hypothetical protein